MQCNNWLIITLYINIKKISEIVEEMLSQHKIIQNPTIDEEIRAKTNELLIST